MNLLIQQSEEEKLVKGWRGGREGLPRRESRIRLRCRLLLVLFLGDHLGNVSLSSYCMLGDMGTYVGTGGCILNPSSITAFK